MITAEKARELLEFVSFAAVPDTTREALETVIAQAEQFAYARTLVNEIHDKGGLLTYDYATLLAALGGEE
jgi:hypothetical protein